MSNKRFAPKYKIKKGDSVKVIAGSSKGTVGNVLEIHHKTGKAVVEGVNIAKKHTKPTNDNPGGINDITLPIDISNLAFVDSKTKAITKIGYRIENGKSVRFSKKTGETIK